MTGNNGKHRSDILPNCPTDKCNNSVVILRIDYYMASTPKRCDTGHPYYVWYSPENGTHMVTCD